MNRNDVLTDEEDELLECCEHALMENVDDEYYYFDRDILERYIQGYKFELIKFTTYYKNRNKILSGLVKKKGYVYEFDIAQDTGKISIRTRSEFDFKKFKDSKDSYNRVDSIKSKIAQLKRNKKELQFQIDEIDDEIFELKAELEEKEGYASLEEREIDY